MNAEPILIILLAVTWAWLCFVQLPSAWRLKDRLNMLQARYAYREVTYHDHLFILLAKQRKDIKALTSEWERRLYAFTQEDWRVWREKGYEAKCELTWREHFEAETQAGRDEKFRRLVTRTHITRLMETTLKHITDVEVPEFIEARVKAGEFAKDNYFNTPMGALIDVYRLALPSRVFAIHHALDPHNARPSSKRTALSSR